MTPKLPGAAAERYARLRKGIASCAILIALCIFFAVVEPRFLNASNILNVLRLAAILSLAAYGQSIVILAGGIDLSIGSIAAVVSIAAAMGAREFGNLPGFLIGVFSGTVLGATNGVLVAFLRLPAFIATFGMLVYAEGIANFISRGAPIEFMPDGFDALGSGYIGPVPLPIIISLILFVLVQLMLTRTPFGRYLYAIGGNEKAAWLSGIDVKKYRMMAYTISGLLAGLTAVVLTSRINSGQANLAPSLPFDTIAAAAVGGLSMYGGQGRLYQPVVGALIITVTNNGLNLMNVSSYVQMMVIGIVILLAVSYDNYRLSEKMRTFLKRGLRLEKSRSLRPGSS